LATLRDIKLRIRSVREIQKITRAMKMVAAAKLRKAQKKQAAFEPFYRGVDLLLWGLHAEVEKKDHLFLHGRKGKKAWLIVFTSDRGLCGAYNHHVERAVDDFIRGERDLEISLLVSGRQGIIYFKRRGYDMVELELPDEIDRRIRVISHFVTGSYLSGRVDRVQVVSDRFRLNRERGVRNVQLLPFVPADAQSTDGEAAGEAGKDETRHKIKSYLMEPGIDAVFDRVCRLYILSRFFRFYLDSEAAEQLARMTAMDLATSNADSLIFDLTLSYNKARQEAITKELIDILGGSQGVSI